MASTPVTTIRLSKELRDLIQTTSREVGIKPPDTHRQALSLGCPELVKRLKKKK